MSQQLSGKCVLLGASEVGKSCIALRFIRNTFVEDQPATLGAAFLTQIVQVGEKQFKFEIWDTAGQERFASIAPMYYRGSQFAVVVYDVTDASTFERAKNWIQEVKQKSMTNTIICVCGNKCDNPKEAWKVDSEIVKKYCASMQLLFYETSAKENVNIQEVFMELAKTFIKNQAPKADAQPAPSSNTIDKNKKIEKGKNGCC